MKLTDNRAIELISEIAKRRDPALVGLLPEGGQLKLSETQREDLRGLLAEELLDIGLTDADEPSQYGLVIESLIDWLGRA
ncbi:MAG TPA: hypothetical protein VEY93_00940 [Longimicrobium sp.]|nr:hypothetical protein [Longimicrobium sp.]